MKKYFAFTSMLLLSFVLWQCTLEKKGDNMKTLLSEKTVKQAIDSLTHYYGNSKDKLALIEKGVTQAAALWDTSDGSADDFIAFCKENYAPTDSDR